MSRTKTTDAPHVHLTMNVKYYDYVSIDCIRDVIRLWIA